MNENLNIKCNSCGQLCTVWTYEDFKKEFEDMDNVICDYVYMCKNEDCYFFEIYMPVGFKRIGK